MLKKFKPYTYVWLLALAFLFSGTWLEADLGTALIILGIALVLWVIFWIVNGWIEESSKLGDLLDV